MASVPQCTLTLEAVQERGQRSPCCDLAWADLVGLGPEHHVNVGPARRRGDREATGIWPAFDLAHDEAAIADPLVWFVTVPDADNEAPTEPNCVRRLRLEQRDAREQAALWMLSAHQADSEGLRLAI
jgi:hypothetical protein